MTAYDFLSEYSIVIAKIHLIRDKIADIHQLMKILDRRSCEAALSEYQDKLYSETEELIKLRFAVENAIEKCPCTETEREVLSRRFILCEKWNKISDTMLFSLQHLHRLEESALKKVIVPLNYR